MATVRNLWSLLQAAETSSGKVGLPAFTLGCSPPTGHLGAGCGELPVTSTGTVPKWSRYILNSRPRLFSWASLASYMMHDIPMVWADILMKSVCRNISWKA